MSSPPAPAQSEPAAAPPSLRLARPPEPSPAPARMARLPWALILPLAVAPVLFAAVQTGRWHADEVYQYLEPAWWRVHHYGVLAWEWKVGLRNWASPIVIAWFIRLAEAVGARDPRVIRVFVGIPLLALHLGLLVSTWRYLERRLRHQGRAWTTLAFVLVATFAPVLLFSGRTMGESISTAFLVMACEALDRERNDRPWHAGAFAGVMLGLSVVARYGSGVFVVAALLWLLCTRRFRMFWATCAAGILVAAGLAGLDWATWGKPFHSFLTYADFNVFSGRAAQQFGAHPGWFYLPMLGAWIAFWAWPGLVGALWREKRIPLPVFISVTYLAAISATPHKEERFLYPALVLFALGTAAGLVILLRKIRGGVLRLGMIALALAAGCIPWFYAPEFRGDEFRAQVVATRPDDATGLLIVGEGIWGSGGYFYLGKNIPFYNADLVPHIQQVLRRDPRVNRVITWDGLNRAAIEAEGFQLIARIGHEDILARRR